MTLSPAKTRPAVGIRKLVFASAVLLAVPSVALAESKSRFDAAEVESPAVTIDPIDLAGERATGLPPQPINVEDGISNLSIILWDELKRPGTPDPSSGAQSIVGNHASVANGQALR